MGIEEARRKLPGVMVGADYVSVSFSSAHPGCFDWRIDLADGESYLGITPQLPSRYLNGTSLTDALISVLYCMWLEAHPEPPIRHLIRFPYDVGRWAVDHHEEIKSVLRECMEREDRHAPVTLLAVVR